MCICIPPAVFQAHALREQLGVAVGEEVRRLARGAAASLRYQVEYSRALLLLYVISTYTLYIYIYIYIYICRGAAASCPVCLL